MAGTRGPVPKRSSQRRRQNKPESPVTAGKGAADVSVPDPEEHWHPLATAWYESLAESGQAHWYEPSDWATAKYIAEAMSRNLLAGAKFSSVLFASVLSGMSNLLVTEGDRRRVRVELERADGGDADDTGDVSELEEYRRRLAR
jgi:hypothetical protein